MSALYYFSIPIILSDAHIYVDIVVISYEKHLPIPNIRKFDLRSSHGIALHRCEAHELRGLRPVQRQTVDPEAGGGAQGVLVQDADPLGGRGNGCISQEKYGDMARDLYIHIWIYMGTGSNPGWESMNIHYTVVCLRVTIIYPPMHTKYILNHTRFHPWQSSHLKHEPTNVQRMSTHI